MNTVLPRLSVITLFAALAAIPVVQAHWDTNGTAVCDTTGDQVEHVITSDGLGGAFVAWVDNRSVPDLYAQNIDSLGARRWDSQGVPVCTAVFGQFSPQIIPDGAGGAILVWEDGRPDPNLDIYGQRVGADGAAAWTLDGVAVCQAADDQEEPQLVSDGHRGTIIVWQDRRDHDTQGYDIYAQRIDSLGAARWTADGIAVCTAPQTQEEPQITEDGAGGAIIIWLDYRSGADHIYAQRIDGDGNALWPAGGLTVCTASGPRFDPHIISDQNGGAIIVWQDRRSFYDIYAQRIDPDGNALWTVDGVPVCQAPGFQAFPNLVTDGAGGAVVSWQDLRSGDWDIYARRINDQGDTLWTPNGVQITSLTHNQYNPRLVSDGQGGAIIAWEENRTGDDPDIYTQRVDGGGSIMWTGEGIPVCAAPAGQNFPRITTDGARGAIVIWADQRNDLTQGTDVFIGSMNEFGEAKVPAMVTFYQAATHGTGVLIRWTLSDYVPVADLTVSRSDAPASGYYDLPHARIEFDGLGYSCQDLSCRPGRSYCYRVDITGPAGRKQLFQTPSVSIPVSGTRLEQNHPNPFNPSTSIDFNLAADCRVELTVFDPGGRKVKTLTSRAYPAGRHQAQWDGTDEHGNPAGTGVYLYRLRAGKTILTKKMTLVK